MGSHKTNPMKIVFKLVLFGMIVFNCLHATAQDSNSAIPAIQEIFKQFDNVRDFTLSNSGDEAYFTGQSPLAEVSVIFKISKINGSWQKPKLVPFSGKSNDLEPFLSPDNLRLYFVSNRQLYDTASQLNYDIWYVERKALSDAWSEPVNLGPTINTQYDEFYPSVAHNGNLYFTSVRPGMDGKDDIFFSKWENGQYAEPATLSDSVNTDGYEYNAFISPDESYLIFGAYNRPDGLGSGDLYISFYREGQWTKGKNLGNSVNSKWMDYCPFVVGDTLFFTSKRVKEFGKGLEIDSYDNFVERVVVYENGLSRIYQLPGFLKNLKQSQN